MKITLEQIEKAYPLAEWIESEKNCFMAIGMDEGMDYAIEIDGFNSNIRATGMNETVLTDDLVETLEHYAAIDAE